MTANEFDIWWTDNVRKAKDAAGIELFARHPNYRTWVAFLDDRAIEFDRKLCANCLNEGYGTRAYIKDVLAPAGEDLAMLVAVFTLLFL